MHFAEVLFCVLCLSISVKCELCSEDDFVPATQRPLVPLPSSRIVGGSDALLGQFPFQVSLRDRDSHICGGSIISKNYVLTAAHCVTTRIPLTGFFILTHPSRLSIRTGTNSINSGGVVVKVAEVKVNAKYKSFTNDIALLRLSKPLEFNPLTQPIRLAERTPTPNTSVFVSGFGRVRQGGPLATQLKYNVLRSMDNEACQKIMGKVPTSILCLAHTENNGVCQGDSGGPAAYNGTLVGVANFVLGKCGLDAPDGYANVASFVSWIRQNSDVETN